MFPTEPPDEDIAGALVGGVPGPRGMGPAPLQELCGLGVRAASTGSCRCAQGSGAEACGGEGHTLLPPVVAVAVSGGLGGQGWWRKLAKLIPSNSPEGRNGFSILPAATSVKPRVASPHVSGIKWEKAKKAAVLPYLPWGWVKRKRLGLQDTVPSPLRARQPWPGCSTGACAPSLAFGFLQSDRLWRIAAIVLLEVSFLDVLKVEPLSHWFLSSEAAPAPWELRR